MLDHNRETYLAAPASDRLLSTFRSQAPMNSKMAEQKLKQNYRADPQKKSPENRMQVFKRWSLRGSFAGEDESSHPYYGRANQSKFMFE